jgi:hypothetical protein
MYIMETYLNHNAPHLYFKRQAPSPQCRNNFHMLNNYKFAKAETIPFDSLAHGKMLDSAKDTAIRVFLKCSRVYAKNVPSKLTIQLHRCLTSPAPT